MGNGIKSDEKQRLYLWDNYKCFLIFLVVLGHFLIPIRQNGGSVLSIFLYLEIFHMPAFVFISGYFSKRFLQKDSRKRFDKIVGFLVIYILLMLGIAIIGLCFGEGFILDFFNAGGAPWYMLAMVVWYLFLPYFAEMKPWLALPILVGMGLYCGFERGIGSILSLSRIIVWFPFFMLGYYFEYKKPKHPLVVKIVCAAAMLGLLVLVYKYRYWIYSNSTILYAARGYVAFEEKMSLFQAMFMRLGLYVISTICTFAFLYLMPNRNIKFITKVGERTLSVYVVHRLLRDVMQYGNWYDKLPEKGYKLLICMLLISALVVAISCIKYVNACFDYLITRKYSKFFFRER